ncbi:MAG: ABC transporter permease subunit [Blastocatellia bacterium]|nr:ABC transporter permease subunit [Blastocatellia bacterium]
MNFIHSFQSEWLKKRRSLASWLVIVGAFFTPTIILLVRLKNYQALPKLNAEANFWTKLWFVHWESMTVMLLPMGIILAVGLITQIEYKNNTWKQLHTTPQSYTTIFFAKFLVILLMMIEVFVLFNLGMYLSAVVPSLIFNVPFPTTPIPFSSFFYGNLNFFIDCLPILALQYLISLQYKNFLVPIGVGFVIWVLGVGMLSWEHSYIFPYIHAGMDFMVSSGHLKRELPINLQLLAFMEFAGFLLVGYVLYSMKREKA